VLEVLLRKHERIRRQLGVSVPMPADAGRVADAILEGIVARGRDDLSFTEQLSLFAEVSKEHENELHKEWDAASEREKRTNPVYAQYSIHTEEVARELTEARDAIGDVASVERFASTAITANGGRARSAPAGGLIADISEVPAALRDAIGEAARGDTLEIVATGGALTLNRSHPVVQALAAHVVDTALDAHGTSAAARCGVLRTRAVVARTTLLLIRTRIHLTVTQRDRDARELLAEDALLAAFTGTPDNPAWLSEEATAKLLDAEPDGNVARDVAVRQLERARDAIPTIEPHLDELAHSRAAAVLDAHCRVRASARAQGSYAVRPQLPVDVLGLYVYLPVADA
jgi:hypothetical protein